MAVKRLVSLREMNVSYMHIDKSMLYLKIEMRRKFSTMSDILNIIADETLTYHQQVLALARYAENTDHTLELSPE